uniref:BAR domain-containing protein n=1 Tax=Caenorhabditis tropicalis TaxID=1561998 RepID=A0A1I7UNY5_9PELO
MFGRLKQKVKEKTGRAKATSLPVDVDEATQYFKALQSRVKDHHKHMADLSDIGKWQKKANFSNPLENYARLGDKVNIQPFLDAVNARISAETDAIKGVQNECDKFKAYYQNDCKIQQESISYLNKTRLDMDSAADKFASNESDVAKMKLDTATKEFEGACARLRELAGGIKDLEANHSSWQDSIMKEIKVAFRKE